jgi:hypothetical protein
LQKKGLRSLAWGWKALLRSVSASSLSFAGFLDSGVKDKTVAKSRFKFPALAICAALMTFATTGWGQTYYDMSTANYSNTFTSLSAYPANFTGQGILSTGSIPAATKTTTDVSSLSSVGTSTGVQNNSASGNLLFLATGSTDNSVAVACDLNLNFTGKTAGNLSFDYALVFNTAAAVGRALSLQVYYSTDGSAWTALSGPYTVYNTTGSSTAAISTGNIALPSALNGQPTVKIRFYAYNGGTVIGTPSGNRPKISIDNVAVTSTSSASAPTVTTPTVSSISTTSATLGANVTANGGSTLTSRGTVWGTAATPTGNSLAEGGTATGVFTHSRTGLTANTAYYYRGYAINNVGTAYSVDGAFTTLPLPPTVGAGSSATTSGFTANWSVPTMGSAVYTYTVEVDNDSNFGSPDATVANIVSSITSQAITGLASGTTYYYRVKSVNSQGSSAYSSTSAGITTSAPSGTLSTSTGSLSALTATTYGTGTAAARTMRQTKGSRGGCVHMRKGQLIANENRTGHSTRSASRGLWAAMAAATSGAVSSNEGQRGSG